MNLALQKIPLFPTPASNKDSLSPQFTHWILEETSQAKNLRNPSTSIIEILRQNNKELEELLNGFGEQEIEGFQLENIYLK